MKCNICQKFNQVQHLIKQKRKVYACLRLIVDVMTAETTKCFIMLKLTFNVTDLISHYNKSLIGHYKKYCSRTPSLI